MRVEAVGRNVRIYRVMKGLTQSELSLLVKCKPSRISSIETGKHKASVKLLCLIASILGVGLDDLIKGGVDDASSN
ncbi:helix-turn-helix transcriptional regulator [Paenibacillus phyllosphaerae]|uniref:helix-turn-helix transcriptional regulator n=1 Tax=Paenibacillus phyllosphaerae TaxID=274593 RepID=UPI003CCDC836